MQDSVVFEALLALEQAVAPVRTLINDFTTVFTQHENSHDDVPSRLKAMRRSYASSLQFLHRLQEFERTITQFARRIGRFESHISRTALNYGFNLLPDDVLSEIFVFAAATLEEKVALSFVCKRFRRVMMSNRKMWDGYWVESTQPPEQIIAIAEGHGFVSLKARIHKPDFPPSHVMAWVVKRARWLDQTGYTLRYHKFSVGLILSFGLEELVFDDLSRSTWKEVEPILGGANVQNLRSLVMPRDVLDPTGRYLESWHTPLLQNLEVNYFVPKPAYAANLVRWRCTLMMTGEHQIHSLREFLRAAISLRDLQLRLCLYHTRPFYDVCDLPSLRSLAVNFVPHPSLARRLIRFQLSLSLEDWVISLRRLLDFLSSSDALEQLATDDNARGRRFSEGHGAIDALPVVTMPSVVSCQLLSHTMGATLIAKLLIPNLRTLRFHLRGLDGLSKITRNEFRTSLQSMSSLEELELMESKVGIADLDEIIRYAPPHLESFSLKGCSFSVTAAVYWNTTPAPSRNLIHFKDCDNLKRDRMLGIVDHLKTVGLSWVEIQFDSCEGWTDGTFGLDGVMDAQVDREDGEDLESDGWDNTVSNQW